MEKRTRVLVDLLSYTGTKGGMETYARELYRELGSMDTGLEFVALASREGGRMDLSWFPGEVIKSQISGENRAVWALGELVASSGYASRRKVDLVHSPATLGPMWTRMPAVVTIHDTLYWSHPELMPTALYTRPVKLMERLVSRNASQVITDSEFAAGELAKYLKIPSGRLHVIPLAGRAKVAPGEYATDSRRRPLLLASGQRLAHKNWDGLLRGLVRIPADRRPQLCITGAHGDDPLVRVVAELGLGEWVDLRGWVEEAELVELYRTATALVFPTFVEGFGLPVVEAMASGLPVLCSDIPVFREVAGDAVRYFDPHSPDDIAHAIESLLADPAALVTLAAAGPGQAANFTWHRCAEATLAVFELALSGGGRG